MFLFGLIIGIAIGTIFSAVIIKWANKAKTTAKEFAHDVQQEASKHKI